MMWCRQRCWAMITWWRHQMDTFSALLAFCAGNSPVTGEFPAQRPVTRSFDLCFDLRLNKQLSKQSWGWWFDTPSCSSWGQCNENGPHEHIECNKHVITSVCNVFVNIWRVNDHFIIVGLRPVIEILCHVLARGWGRWLRYFTEAKAEVKYRASARIRRPKHDTRFEWPVSILIMTRHPFLPFKTHKTSAKNPRLLTITGAIWFCRYRQCTPSQLWMHAPVANERRLMTSQYHIFDRRDSLNP